MLVHMPPVLMYHQVDEKPQTTALARALTVTPSQFAAELDYLKASRRRAVSVDEYLQAVRTHRPTSRMVIVTFDDGYADQYTRAFPILRAHHAHATFFITTGNVGKMNHVTWRDIGIMQRAGMSFGGHSVDHIDLAALSAAQQRAQIDGSLDALAAHLGSRPDAYAYPAGTFDRTTETVLDSTAVALAFTTDASFQIGAERRFELSRIRVERDMTMASFGTAIAMPPAIAFSLDALPQMQMRPLRPQAATPQP